MSFARALFLISALALGGCEDMMDNLDPSSEDLRPTIDENTEGHRVGQTAPDFTIPDTLNNSVTISAELQGANGIVLYFTMWCPICDAHMTHMRSNIIPNYPNVKFYFIDYVSGSVQFARTAQISNGYADAPVLVDTDQAVMNLYNATMGTTVVIGSDGVVAMNEDYKDGSRLNEILGALP